jgi:dTDP-4-dehydrorhamnose reductase
MAAVVVLGGSGLVGSRVCELWSPDVELIVPSHAELDVLDSKALNTFLAGRTSTSVVNLVAAADVDGSEPESGDTQGRVYRVNVDYPRRLAELCRHYAHHLVHISTDYVFDGTKAEAPYAEDEPTGPPCWYAETKRLGELAVLGADSSACVARIEMPFSSAPHAKRDLARLVATRLQQGQTMQTVTDQRITPIFLDDAASALRRLAEARFSGVVHIAASDWTTPYDLAGGIARRLGLNRELIVATEFKQFAATRPARRPQHSWLDVTRFTRAFGAGILRPVDDALDVWTRQWQSS